MKGQPTKMWVPGDEVSIGYMTLVVGRRIPTPGDGKPDIWLVHSLDGTRDYHFQPYSGLKLIADRRPKPAPKVHAAPRTPAVAGKARRVVSTASDKGIGRETGVQALGARLNRLESMLERIAGSLDPGHQVSTKDRRSGGGKGKG